jgi:hypothetical protein
MIIGAFADGTNQRRRSCQIFESGFSFHTKKYNDKNC